MRFRRTAAAIAVAATFPLILAAAPSASADSLRPRCTIVGTTHDDILHGTPGRDVICGLDGDDLIYGLSGDDLLIGGPGDDRLAGGEDRDVLIGGKGDDDLTGGADDDLLLGQTGDDHYAGGDGDDQLLNTMAGVNDFVVRVIMATNGNPVRFTLLSPASECVKDVANPPLVDTASPAELFTIEAQPWCIWGEGINYQLSQADGNRRFTGVLSVKVRLNPNYSMLNFTTGCTQDFQCLIRGDRLTVWHTR